MGALRIDDLQIDLDHEYLRLIYRPPYKDLTGGIGYKTLAPEFDPIAAIRRLMADAVRRNNVAPIRDGVSTLNGFPGGMMALAVFRFL